jgi:hypothetical protein
MSDRHNQDDDFVFVLNKNGETQSIPRKWLDNPELSKGFTLADTAQSLGASDGTVAAIVTAVGDDKAKAAAALAAEQAKGDKARKSLVAELQAVIDAPSTDPSGDPAADNDQADGQKES